MVTLEVALVFQFGIFNVSVLGGCSKHAKLQRMISSVVSFQSSPASSLDAVHGIDCAFKASPGTRLLILSLPLNFSGPAIEASYDHV